MEDAETLTNITSPLSTRAMHARGWGHSVSLFWPDALLERPTRHPLQMMVPGTRPASIICAEPVPLESTRPTTAIIHARETLRRHLRVGLVSSSAADPRIRYLLRVPPQTTASARSVLWVRSKPEPFRTPCAPACLALRGTWRNTTSACAACAAGRYRVKPHIRTHFTLRTDSLSLLRLRLRATSRMQALLTVKTALRVGINSSKVQRTVRRARWALTFSQRNCIRVHAMRCGLFGLRQDQRCATLATGGDSKPNIR